MQIDPFKLPAPCRSGQLCQLCRAAHDPAGETFRLQQRARSPEMFATNFVCNFGLGWGHEGPAPWAHEFASSVRARVRESAADHLARSAGFGPGDVVKIVLTHLGYKPHPGCGCDEFRDQMNRWGWRGCVARRQQIVAWFLVKAREQNIAANEHSVWSQVRAGLKDLLRRRRKSA